MYIRNKTASALWKFVLVAFATYGLLDGAGILAGIHREAPGQRRRRRAGNRQPQEPPLAPQPLGPQGGDAAKAAEAMRLASESAAAAKTGAPKADDETAEPHEAHGGEAAAQPQAPAGEAAAQPEAPAGSTADDNADDLAARISALLQENDVQLTDRQLATVADALEGPDGRQGFYRRIIRIERQQNGRALYRLVRDHYAALTKLIG